MTENQNTKKIISGFSHSFDTGIASELGLNAAIVFNNIIYWLRFNASKKNSEMIDGKYWMYETQKEMAESIGYLSEDEIFRSLKKLCENGLLLKNKLSSNPFDRKNYYTVADQTLINGFKNKFSKPRQDGMGLRTSAESDPAPPRDVYNEHNNKQEQQQTTPFVVAETSIFGCLKEIGIPERDKKEISNTYPEQVVKDAVEFCIHDDFDVTTTLQQAIKWACKEKMKRSVVDYQQHEARNLDLEELLEGRDYTCFTQ